MKTSIKLPFRHDVPRSEQCGHGYLWTEDCKECEIISLVESLGWMEKQVNRDRARLERLRKETSDNGDGKHG